MFNRIANSWDLIKASARVLQADKELMVFPIISAIGTLLVSAVFILPIFFSNFLDSVFMGGSEVLGLVVLFVFYIVEYTVIFFANTALVAAAMKRLNGGDPTLADGFRAASQRIGPILGYALISATVGMILRMFSSRNNTFGRIIVGLIGLAWNVATFLVVPVLAVENIGPIEAVKRSVELLRRTWGEQIAGNIGMNLIFGLISFGIILLAVPAAYLAIAVFESGWLVAGLVVVVILLMLAIGLVSTTLNGIFTAAVYQYATTGQVSGFFDETLVANTFRSQPRKSFFGTPAGY
ncbi:MAG TPA: DUF6159 family protein [Anaerolineaceae bacterium]|nr:DUF6159 family protein [Anaerolineaceae bacterium]